MRERLLALAEHRTRLVARARSERESIAKLVSATDAVSSMVDAAIRAVRRLLREAMEHPLLAIAGGAILAAIRPRRAIGWMVKGWSLYRLYRSALPLWQRFAASAGTPADRPRHPS